MERGRTHVSYERTPGFCDRICKSLGGVVIGSILLLIATALLFWNEGRAVQTAKSLDEGLFMVVPLSSPYVVSMENNGKLVHLTGPLHADQVLTDMDFNVVVNAVKLRRVVEMYQWEEHVSERKIDEGNGQTRVEKEYSYTQSWRSDAVRSNGFDDSFNHMNPSEIPVPAKTYEAEKVTVGEFLLSNNLKSQVSNFVILPLDASQIGQTKNLHIYNDHFYQGQDPTRPQIGDVRVKFEYAGISFKSHLGPPTVVSIIARQLNGKLLPYQTVAGDVLETLYEGKYSAKEIFGKKKMENSLVTWGVRIGGWVLTFIAFTCLTSIITVVVDWLPIIRDLVTMGVCMMNMSLSISVSLTVIAIAWIFYRPLLGMAILAMAATPFILSRMRTQSHRSRMH